MTFHRRKGGVHYASFRNLRGELRYAFIYRQERGYQVRILDGTMRLLLAMNRPSFAAAKAVAERRAAGRGAA